MYIQLQYNFVVYMLVAGRISAVGILTPDSMKLFALGSECPLRGDLPLCSLLWYENLQNFPFFKLIATLGWRRRGHLSRSPLFPNRYHKDTAAIISRISKCRRILWSL